MGKNFKIFDGIYAGIMEWWCDSFKVLGIWKLELNLLWPPFLLTILYMKLAGII